MVDFAREMPKKKKKKKKKSCKYGKFGWFEQFALPALVTGMIGSGRVAYNPFVSCSQSGPLIVRPPKLFVEEEGSGKLCGLSSTTRITHI